VLKVFEDGAEGCDEMVVVKDIPFYSKCEHHMADIFGTATIAYVPNGKIVGLSKLNRLLDIYARRLQVQERLTAQVADALMEHLQPKGSAVLIKARHMCMESRGVRQQGHHTITSALRGVFKTESATRAEFMALAR
jgi:GTP cyclohydrolase I